MSVKSTHNYLIFLSTLFTMAMSQPYSDKSNYPVSEQFNRLNSIVSKVLNDRYYVEEFLDVDCVISRCLYNYYHSLYIEEVRENQFHNSFIVVICSKENDYYSDSLNIAIIKNDEIKWMSKPLYFRYPRLLITGIGDMDNDGTTDILFSNPLGARNNYEGLWIISPDSLGGKLLNGVNIFNESNLVGLSESFYIYSHVDGSKTITSSQSIDDDEIISYTWNGKVFSENK